MRWWLPLFIAAGTLVGGCSDVTIDSAIRRVFESKRTAQQYMLVAVSDSDPDMRRAAVTKVAKSKQYNQSWAVKGFIAIALLESDPQARCAAIRALARTRDPRAAETLLKILNYRQQPPQEVRPPDALCRWDATMALANLSAAGQIPEGSADAVRTTLLERLRSDTDRHVRLAAARGLGHHGHPESLRGLIDGLRDMDFAVVHECESALVRLTGRTHNCEVSAWEEWYQSNQGDLFTHAGEVPASRRAPYDGRLGQLAYDVRQFFRWMVPERKEQ